MDELEDIHKAVTIVWVPESHQRQRQGLRDRAYSEEGKNEPLAARLSVRIKPVTLARLKLYTEDAFLCFPPIDLAVDEALHD